jgi:hypothetical protein
MERSRFAMVFRHFQFCFCARSDGANLNFHDQLNQQEGHSLRLVASRPVWAIPMTGYGDPLN